MNDRVGVAERRPSGLVDQPHNGTRRRRPPRSWKPATYRRLIEGHPMVCRYTRPDLDNVLACSNCDDPIPGGDDLLACDDQEWIACSLECARDLLRG